MNKGLIVFFILLASCSPGTKPEEAFTERKPKAAVKKVFTDRKFFQLEYYKDWRIDSSDKSFDPDNFFELSSASDNGFIMFYIFEKGIEAKSYVDKQAEGYAKAAKKAKITNFEQWGNYKGYGAKIEGFLMGLQCEAKFFAWSKEGMGLSVATQIFTEDRAMDEPGLELIESTFKLKE